MIKAAQQRQLRQWLSSPMLLAIVLVLAGMLAWSAIERGVIAYEARERRLLLEAEVEQLRQRQLTLEADVEYLESERGQEAEMRRQFDVALPGEQVVVIVGESQAASAAEALQAATSTERAARWYQFWR